MKKTLFILFALIFALSACEEEVMPKPEQLLKKKQVVEVLVDVHLAESYFNHFRNDSFMTDFSTADFYYSVLDKYEIPDSVFEQSLVYYASFPKEFEKMYRTVMSQLGEIEQEHSGRSQELIIEEQK